MKDKVAETVAFPQHGKAWNELMKFETAPAMMKKHSNGRLVLNKE